MYNCPYCGNIGDSYFKIHSRNYIRCFACNLIFLHTRKSYDDEVATYQESYFSKYSIHQIGGKKNILFNKILDLIERKKEIGKLFDIGTGCGSFLIAAQERGWKVKGIDPSVQAVEVAQSQLGLDVSAGTLQDCRGNEQFDVITFINVLDHSAQPWLEIHRAKKFLRPGGLIYLRFPNGFLHSGIFRLAHILGLNDQIRKFLVFHRYAFTPSYIIRLLEDHGLLQTLILNSPPSEGDPDGLFPNSIPAYSVKKLFHLFAQSARVLSGGKFFLGSSIAVITIQKA